MESDCKMEQVDDFGMGVAAKSSVKLTKNSKGTNWEIKIVVGESELIENLMLKAIECHNKLKTELKDE